MSTICGMTVTFCGGGISGSTVPQVTVTAPTGSTVTAKKGDITLTAAEKNGVWVFDLPEFGAWVITATNGVQTVTENVVFEGSKAVTFSYFSATIAVTYPAGSTCTCSNGAAVLTAPDTSGSCTFIVTGTGTWTVECSDGNSYASESVNIVNDGQASTVELAYKPVASTYAASGVSYTSGLSGLDTTTVRLFSEAISNNSAITDTTSVVYIDYDTIHRKISIGDQVSLSLNGTSYAFDVIGFNHDTLATSTAYGKATATGKAGITLQMHDCFATLYRMGSGNKWETSEMRTSTLVTMKGYLPDDWEAIITPVNKITSAGSASSTLNTLSENCFLLAEIEVFGSASKSYSGEGSQYAYYRAGNSKSKKKGSSDQDWRLRSPQSGSSSQYCIVLSWNGSVSVGTASSTGGVAFAFCV